jgi:hypothetical protein
MADADEWEYADESETVGELTNGGPAVPPNWADFLLAASHVPHAFLCGMVNAIGHVQGLLRVQSVVLDERKERTRFAKEATKALRDL